MLEPHKRITGLLHLGLEVVTKVGSIPKSRFESFKVTPSNYRGLCVNDSLGHSTRELLARGRFFEELEDSRNFSEYIYFFKYWKED